MHLQLHISTEFELTTAVEVYDKEPLRDGKIKGTLAASLLGRRRNRNGKAEQLKRQGYNYDAFIMQGRNVNEIFALCSVDLQLVTEVPGQPINPIFKGQAVQVES